MLPVLPMLSWFIAIALLVGGVYASRRMIHNLCFFFSIDESSALVNLGEILHKATRIFLIVQATHVALMLIGAVMAAPEFSGGIVVLCFYAWLGFVYVTIILKQLKPPTLLRLVIIFIALIIQVFTWLTLVPMDFYAF